MTEPSRRCTIHHLSPEHYASHQLGFLYTDLRGLTQQVLTAQRRARVVDPKLVKKIAEIKKDIARIKAGDFTTPIETCTCATDQDDSR